ncbi:GH35 family endo-1,4-beta-xylanase [Herbinix hemicellulosilytica]|uniref:Beta-xylanase n=1 Tax=Herbinix hemicellulosilytica TaxID=1564487 RepID=A0A0H5SIJ4_HERHM|nr:endo-1,4-beta-xylanase [Herbinix hemicellulosilytica]RBP56759.1 GH35 family endo-1,4-beta-xylanase [Herbinix hemicellulosilytica]CRZ35304.1 hypothetical protein HHT355_2106 [Herbinix hemicellulosilytica]
MDNKYKHRMATSVIRFVGKDGSPLANKRIDISQTKHEFMFACGAFDTVALVNDLPFGEDKELLKDRMDKWLALFNTATLPFYWGQFEPEKGKPHTEALMKAARWLKDRGVTLKGHPLCWHTQTAPWLLDMTNEEILKAQLDRIRREVSEFKGVIDMWDVINEVVIMPIFDKYDNGITRICKELGRIPLIREVFQAAKEANPNAVLLINDFNTSISYEIMIEGCLEAGIPIDAIGIQSHQHQGYWGVEKIQSVLERFSHFGLPLHFTENTLISGDLMPPEIEDLNDFQVDEWPTTPEGEERQAKEVVELYRTLFADPSVEAITTWCIVDGKWLKAPAGFLRADNSCKPSYDALYNLIKKEWWTNVTVMTDDNGFAEVTGFLGDYEAKSEGLDGRFKIAKNSPAVTVCLE